jgi:YcaO-like protein with predicted kinase domain
MAVVAVISDIINMREKSLIRLLNKYGMINGCLVSYDCKIFSDKNIIQLLEELTAMNPTALIPLRRIIINKRISSLKCFDNIYQNFSSNIDNIIMFQNKFNIKVDIDIHLLSFDAKKAIVLCDFFIKNEIDSINFIFDFPTLSENLVHQLITNFECFCLNPILRTSKIRLQNFPFCFIPVSKYKYLYSHIVNQLKGGIFYQRNIIVKLKNKTFNYFKICQNCRCRIPCYAYTDIQQFPSYESFLQPRTQSTVVFAGGSLLREDYINDSDIVYVSPAEQGDMLMTILEGFKNILIIDGYFYSKFPCTTFEVMLALENNINVFGSSSIGALRAVELDNYGMRGIGYVYNYLKKQRIKPYHIVAQVYDEQDKPLSTPLVNIIYFLESALNEGVISKDDFDKCFNLVDNIHFLNLSFKYFFKQLKSKNIVPESVVSELENYLFVKGEQYFDIKKKDALLLLNNFKSILQSQNADYVKKTFNQAKERYLKILYSKYHCNYDFTLPKEWRLSSSFRKDEDKGFSCSRDHRGLSPKETLKLVQNFFEDLDIIIADTTKYDTTNNFIISIFFIPFYFLERSVSSSTGNGDVFEEALVSAYMELLERIPLYGFNINSLKLNEINGEVFPYKNLPQYYNWDVSEEEKLKTIKDLGYIKATEILTERDIFIPKFSAMLSSDGNASGNSLAEAILYGIYELIERDILRIYQSIGEELKSALIINIQDIKDGRCRLLLKLFEEKGCKLILYNLLNIYELPCITCEVYDLNSRIKRHGGTAARIDFNSAVFNCLSEAYMGYIIDFMGVRDDFRSLFNFDKDLHLAFKQKQSLFSKNSNFIEITFPKVRFNSIFEELNSVIKKLTNVGVKDIIVLDNSPINKFKLNSVKVIIPKTELITIKPYKPSPLYEAKVRQTIFIITCLAS